MKIIGVFLFSFLQAAVSTILSLLFALPLAHFFYRFQFRLKAFFLALASLLCIMPTKLVVLSISHFYSVDGFAGIILAHIMLNLPFSLYVLNLTYQKLDVTMLWVAADLGASPWQCYRDVVFPFLRSTVVSMVIILFLLHAASYSIPLLLGGQWYHKTPEIMMSQLYGAGKSGQAFFMWVLRVVVFVPLVLLHGRVAKKSFGVGDVVLRCQSPRYRVREHGLGWFVYGLCALVLVLGPFGALLVRVCDFKVFSFLRGAAAGVVDNCLGIPARIVVLNSLFLAIVSGLCAVGVAFVMGLIARIARGRFSQTAVSVLTLLPFVLGSVGMGILFAWFSYGKVVSSFLIGMLCHAFLNYPFAYRVVGAQLDLYHGDMHKSAQALGASHVKVVRTVTLPFVRSALIKAFCISFGLSLTEVGAGSVLQSRLGITMPMAIRMYRKAGMHNEMLGLSMILLILVLLTSYVLSLWTDSTAERVWQRDQDRRKKEI